MRKRGGRWRQGALGAVRLLAVLAVSAMELAFGEVVGVDVYEWSRTRTGLTPAGWDVSGIDEYADNGVRLNTQSEYARSPVYSGCVTQLVMNIRASSETTTCFLKAVPERANAGARTLSAEAIDKYSVQTFTWDVTEGVQQFRLQNIGKGNAGWGIRSLAVYLDRVEAPVEMRSDERYSDAFKVSWTPEVRAVVHELEICRVEAVPAHYGLLRGWDFSSLTNASGNTKDFQLLHPKETFVDVGGTELCLQAWTGGHLQVGKSGVIGTLALPLPTEDDRTALMTLFRHDKDTDGDVMIGSIGNGGETNVLARPVLTPEPTVFAVPLPDEAQSLCFQSRSGRRIRVRDVKVVTEYEPGYATTNAVVRRRTARDECLLKNLTPGSYIWRVRSFDAEGTDSAWSAYQTITLDPEDPPRARNGFVVTFR